MQVSETFLSASGLRLEGGRTLFAQEAILKYYVKISNDVFADKAKVIYAPREVYLPYGKPALLDCHFRANPPLTNLRWEKDGFLFDPYNVQGVFYRRNGSLYFSKVDETHSGSYTCTPYNELGTEGPSPSITVASSHPFFTSSLYLPPTPLIRKNNSDRWCRGRPYSRSPPNTCT